VILNLTTCPRAGRSGALVLAAAGCVLALALSGCGGSPGASGAQAREPSPSSARAQAGSAFTLMQTNLCLSGDQMTVTTQHPYRLAAPRAVKRFEQGCKEAYTLRTLPGVAFGESTHR